MTFEEYERPRKAVSEVPQVRISGVPKRSLMSFNAPAMKEVHKILGIEPSDKPLYVKFLFDAKSRQLAIEFLTQNASNAYKLTYNSWKNKGRGTVSVAGIARHYKIRGDIYPAKRQGTFLVLEVGPSDTIYD